MNRVIGAILSLHGMGAYAVIFTAVCLEASSFLGFVFPGELIVVLGGVLAFHHKVALAGAAAAAVFGAVIGDSIGYGVGARWGHRILGSRLGRKMVKEDHRRRAEEMIRRRGGASVFLGRFTAFLRVLMPGFAGMAGLSYPRFLAYNFAGGAAWGTAFTLAGYLAGDAWERVHRVAARATLLLLLVLILVLAAAAGARWLARREDRVRHWWAAWLERPRVAAFRTRYRRPLEFVVARANPVGAFGLYLTLGLSATAALAWAAGAAIQDVAAGEELALFDGPVRRFMQAHRSGAATRVMGLITHLGSVAWVLPLVALASLVLLARTRRIRHAALLIAAVGGGYAMDGVVKILVHRERPLGGGGGFANLSFPSGHAVAAVALYGGMAFVLSRILRRWGPGVWAWAAAAVLAALIGVSRVYLDMHWASDVIAGWALGAAWLAFCATAFTTWDRLKAQRGQMLGTAGAIRGLVGWILR